MAKFVLSFESEKLTSILPDDILKIEGAWKIPIISSRYIETEELPRVGDYIIYPFWDLADEFKWWVHYNVGFKVEAVIHNPIRVIAFNENIPSIEREGKGDIINTIIKAIPVILEPRY